MSNRRKLIFMWTYLEWGGAQIYFMATMKVARDAWDVLAVLPSASSPEIIRFLDEVGIRYELLDFHLDTKPAPTIVRKLQRQWNRIKTEVATLRFLRRFNLKESILHIETSPWQSWQFLTLMSAKGANVFVTMHNAISSPARWREAVWKARMKFVSSLPGFHLFASNNDTRTKVRPLVREDFWQKIPVTYTCIDPAQINAVFESGRTPAQIRRAHGYSEDDVIVLCVGQFIDRKGRWDFLEAAAMLKASRPDLKFVWVSPSIPSDGDAARIRGYGLNNFELKLSSEIGGGRQGILEFFRAATIFTLPSLVEGLPIALLEAMALGIPSISTSVYAIPEAVKHEDTGILVQAGDPKALAASIERLLDDPRLRERLAQNGRSFVLRNFDEKEAAKIAIEEYAKCFHERS